MKENLDLSLIIQSPKWKSRLKPYKKTVQMALDAAFAETLLKNKSETFELAVVLADDEFVQNLNSQYRGKNQPTNVLSFPNSSPNLGDIILALETVECEAKEQGKTFRDHAIHLLIHGFLHLLGYDHLQEKDAE